MPDNVEEISEPTPEECEAILKMSKKQIARIAMFNPEEAVELYTAQGALRQKESGIYLIL